MNAKYPGKVNYVFRKDAGTTGRLEVNIRNNSDGKTVLAHTKSGGQGYPNKDWSSFDKRVGAVIAV